MGCYYDCESLIDRYCSGKGIEIGPGAAPYSKLPATVYVDKHFAHHGHKYVEAGADDLPFDNDTFDFVLSSHCLEHCPNTIKVLMEWIRVIVPEGILFLVLPHGERTFDQGREFTTLEHHIEDWQNEVDETDTAHWEDFARHSIPGYPHAWIDQGRKQDGSWDFEWIVANGHMHYHVWTQNEIVAVLLYLGCNILVCLEELEERKDSFMVIGRAGKGDR